MTPKRPIGLAVGALVGFSAAAAIAGLFIAFKPARISPSPSTQQVKLYDFAPPVAIHQTQDAMASVTLFNGSPEPLEIVLTNGMNEQVLLQFPPCDDCPTYAPGQTPQTCDAKTTQGTYVLDPGEYEVKAVFKGQTWGFRSRWLLSSGWEHQQCIFSTYDPGGL
ncbi:hypothetical protein [Pseudanabaena sp. FACHB-2040]|uniref:hypothetical protein n=1 Tax=Pseudanabaena sp. FACHB-2040 TaxID=2692859 RepID=UPI0016868E7E|nr:hypothetical protein [Pseudanabaena sp. FACHB-2040]MBD2259917.1 hypothetical protein [Pseudanabaena sp. FACHB-2040]